MCWRCSILPPVSRKLLTPLGIISPPFSLTQAREGKWNCAAALPCWKEQLSVDCLIMGATLALSQVCTGILWGLGVTGMLSVWHFDCWSLPFTCLKGICDTFIHSPYIYSCPSPHFGNSSLGKQQEIVKASSEQPDVNKDIPAHGKRVGLNGL